MSSPRPRRRPACRSRTACAPRTAAAATGALRAVGEHVLSLGAHQLPALVVGRGVFCGERRIAEAVAASRGDAVRRHA